ncbi:MAG: acyl-ACP--UDP-N-acetylglucosamine O-acyltransferase [Puniceicoccales bacterium]|jgi:UDP-N-acetylglucosamine acyltransferase|nr:acyl-ACP--UDP-N-acetylglucosamine O-acyltransferase [Puniceicoccales bacterium]
MAEPAKIHPLAIVEPGARLGAGVCIGPHGYVGGDVVLGDGCTVHHHGTVQGNSTLGRDNEIYPYALIGGRTQDLKYDGSNPPLSIGDRNVFREFSTVHCPSSEGGRTRIGNDNHILAYGHVAHECILGDGIVISSKAVLGGHVEVDSHAIVGGAAAVHQFCKIGTHAFLGGLSALVQDLLPYMIAEGNRARLRSYNLVGLQRHHFSEEDVQGVRRMFRTLYADGRAKGLEKILNDEAISPHLRWEMARFQERSVRGMA